MEKSKVKSIPTNIIYCAFDGNNNRPFYNAEALISCYSLRKNCNNVFIRIFTDKPDYIYTACKNIKGLYFDSVESIEYPGFHKFSKIKAISKGQGNTIFLDTHTIVLDDITLLFEAKDFDIAGSPSPWRESMGKLTKSLVLREENTVFNTGVLFLRMDSCKEFIRNWLDEYLNAYSKEIKAQDQPAFRTAMSVTKDLKLMVLPNNYNFRLIQGGFVSGHVYVIHTHYFKTLSRFIEDPSDKFIERTYNHFSSINNSSKSTVFLGVGYNSDVLCHPLDRSRNIYTSHSNILGLKSLLKNLKNVIVSI